MAARKRLHFCCNDGIMHRLPRPDVSFLYPTMSNTFLCRVSAMATLHLELIAAVPKRHIMTANEFLWPQTTMSEKDSHTMSVWVPISNAVWGWSKYWVCYWNCNSDGIMEYDFPFSCRAPTTEYWSMNYASSIIYVFARSDLINFCQAHNEVVICSIVTNFLCAVAPGWMNRACAKPWPKDKQMSFSRNNHILSWAFVTSFG